MIQTDLLTRLQLALKAASDSLIQVSETQQPLAARLPWAQGDRVQAQVVQELPNGRFQVQIEDFVLDMNLPKNTQAGAKFELVVLSMQPRPTFALAQNIVPAAAAPIPKNNQDVELSDVARLLVNLREKIAQQNQGAAPARQIDVPVIRGAPTDIHQFAQSLKETLTKSGVFYESHQAQWVTGARPLSELMQEPQAKLPLPPQHDALPTSRPANSNASSNAAMPADHDAARTVQQNPPHVAENKNISLRADVRPTEVIENKQGTEIVNKEITNISSLASSSSSSATATPVHEKTLPIVQQQLDVLDSRQLTWQGQVWPGQTMHWQIEEPSHHQGNEQEWPGWHTRLKLNLPTLGQVNALLVLNGNDLRIRILADAQHAKEIIGEHQAELRDALQKTGLTIAALNIDDEQQR